MKNLPWHFMCRLDVLPIIKMNSTSFMIFDCKIATPFQHVVHTPLI